MAPRTVHVVSLHIYPIKSCRGIDITSADVRPMGFAWDRRWMVVDEEGVFLSQRRFPRLATIDVALGRDNLQVSVPDMIEALSVPLDPPTGDTIPVMVWKDQVPAIPAGREADEWFSEALGKRCRLVRQPEAPVRSVDPRYGEPGDHVSLADAYPILVATLDSLVDLNRRMKDPVPMNRFRPNVVVRGAPPYAEDGWTTLTGTDITLRLVKVCSRCVVVTKDQHSGVGGEEPLRTLSTYRERDGKVFFGQNAIPVGTGSIRVEESLTAE
ncbi:MAG: MOSC N-terminal beta barrel domain-containing protein [Bacteroidota bacterium]